jgi:murein DD-endopeptidase MepM/ murein hydrolase activator NlpD
VRRSDRWFHIVALLTVAVFGLSLAVVFPRAPESPGDGRDAELRATPLPVQTRHALGRGEALSTVLMARGLDDAQTRAIIRLLRTYKSPRSLRPGMTVGVAFDPVGPFGPQRTPDQVRITLSPDSVLEFTRSGARWSSRLDLVPFVVDTVCISGVITSSLWSAKLGGDLDRLGEEEFEDLVYDLADIFAWQVDFTRDLRKGDVFRVALERKVRPDGSVRSRHFLAIELRNQDRVLRAIPVPRGSGWAYFDDEGRSLHGAFLRYPVPYRITSRFTSRRFHPILKRWRKHEGIDYGAPIGTPVEATASGVVTRAGFAGGYGRLVELRHAGGIRTRYAHLSAIGAGIRLGARVEQGAVVGRVGASGLATGPHLHYEFVLNGRHVDPLTVELPSQPSLSGARLAEFRKVKDGALSLLEGVPIPIDLRVALSRRQ